MEVVILAAPLLLYGTFNLYRDRVNPSAKVGLTVLAAHWIALQTC